MKKLISLLLILCMACMLIPAMAEESPAGVWYDAFVKPLWKEALQMAKTGPGAMSIPKIMGFIFLFCGLIYAAALIRDLIRNKEALRNAPGDLKIIGILEFIIFVQILDLKCSCKTFAEVVAGAALQGLAVVHQCLDGVGCLGAGELFLIGLLAAHHRNRQILLREIRVDVQHQLGSLLGILIGCMSGVSLLP